MDEGEATSRQSFVSINVKQFKSFLTATKKKEIFEIKGNKQTRTFQLVSLKKKEKKRKKRKKKKMGNEN